MGPACSFDYVVEPDQDHWTVNFGGEHCGRFASRRQALRSAVRDAERVRNLGHQVRVVARYSKGTRQRVISWKPGRIPAGPVPRGGMSGG